MILSLSSSLPSFKTLEFNKGLNILVAQRDEVSGARDTRNGTGKTSMIELIHYLLAEKRNKNDDFHKAELADHSFTGAFKVDGAEISITKKAGLARDSLTLDGEDISAIDLRRMLGQSWFQLEDGITSQTYSPTFGALFAYSVRKERNGGFASPTLNSAKQLGWDMQVNLAYLLGLDWSLPQKLQRTKDDKKQADTLAKMLKSGYLSNGQLDLGKMQARVDLLDGEIEAKRSEVMSATVVDGYRSHEAEANRLAQNIKELNEANLRDLDLVDEIDRALGEVEEASLADIEQLYQEVGVFFEKQVKRRFEQVKSFHAKVAANRKAHLSKEREQATQRLADRKSDIIRFQADLSDRTEVLRSGIAIERLSLLQSELTRLEAERANLKEQIPRLRDVAENQKKLKRDIESLLDLIEADILARDDPRKLAVSTFGEISQFLYNEPGQLVMNRSAKEAGLVIETDIAGKKSGGKNHMQVFCFDWTIAEVAQNYGRSPGFIVHDSHIFDGVDGRQIGLALKQAQMKCDEFGFQYIVAMNSDDLQKIKAEEEIDGAEIFDPQPYILPTRLSDREGGGLFGLRF